MAGTLVSFQGIEAAHPSVVRLSRGYGADESEFVFPGAAWPKFKLTAPKPEELGTPGDANAESVARREEKKADLESIRSAEKPPKKWVAPEGLHWFGTAVLAHVGFDGDEETHVVPGLLVRRIETLQVDDVGAVTWWRVVCADQRILWGAMGLMTRHSFNRRIVEDIIVGREDARAKDSLKPDGSLFKRLEIMRDEILPRLPHAPGRPLKISAYPPEWDTDESPLELEPYPYAVQGMAELVRVSGLEEPCPRWDGSIAFYPPGVGMVGYAAGSVGAVISSGPNIASLPTDAMLDEDGTGQGHVIEPGYNPGYEIVQGGQRVATVAVDDLEPVLVVDEEVYQLDNSTLKNLTQGRFGLDWLKKWILAAEAYQGDTGLPASVVELLRHQAFRLWRIPGARSPFADGGPGKNAHLLPMLDRAEMSGGRRIPPTIESYRFVKIHTNLWSDQTSTDIRTALGNIARIRDLAVNDPRALQGKLAFQQTSLPLAGTIADTVGVSGFADEQQFLMDHYDELQSMLSEARTIRDVGEWGPDLALQYSAALNQKLEATDKLNGTINQKIFDVMKGLVDLESKARQVASTKGLNPLNRDQFNFRNDPLLSGEREKLANRFRSLAVEMRRAAKEKADREAVGASSSPRKPDQAVAHRNLPRSIDRRARVYSDRLGIIETSTIAGHLAREDCATPQSGGPLVLCPPRVIFGSVVRPRTDAPPPAEKKGTATGSAAAGPNEIPLTGIGANPADESQTFTASQQLKRLLSGGSANDPKKPDDLDRIEANRATALQATGLSAEASANIAKQERVKSEEDAKKAQAEGRAKSLAGNHPVCPGGATFIPTALTDKETVYTCCFRRRARGDITRVSLSEVNWSIAAKSVHREMVELLRIDGTSNKASLDQDAFQIAFGRSLKQDLIETSRHVIGRALPVQLDGIICAVEIRTDVDENGGACGFKTTVFTGSTAFYRRTGGGSTEKRPPRVRELDGPRREGLTP